MGRLSHNDVLDADGTLRVHNSLVGEVTTTDGDVVHVNTFSKFTVENDVLELQQLCVNDGR